MNIKNIIREVKNRLFELAKDYEKGKAKKKSLKKTLIKFMKQKKIKIGSLKCRNVTIRNARILDTKTF